MEYIYCVGINNHYYCNKTEEVCYKIISIKLKQNCIAKSKILVTEALNK